MKVKSYQTNPNMLVPYYLMYSYAYYQENESLISDAEYDRAQLQLRNDSSFSETNATGETSLSSITSSSGGSDEFGGTWIQK